MTELPPTAPTEQPDPATRNIWWCGIALLIPVAMFSFAFPLIDNSDRLIDIGKLTDYRPAALAIYVLGIAVMFGAYLWALRLTRHVHSSRVLAPVVCTGVVATLTIASMYPVNAIDLFIYAVRSRIFTAYGQNPQVATPSQFPGDPYMAFSSAEWSVTGSPYGPLWNLIAAPITALTGENLTAALFGFKVLAVISVFVGAWLIGLTLQSYRLPVASGVLLYLWNPLVLWEGVGNGHNDTVMMVPILAAMLAWSRGRDRWVIPLLVVAACIKYVAVLAVPVAVVAIWRRQQPSTRLNTFVVSGVVSAAIAVASTAPFFDVGAIWRSVSEQGTIFLTSPAAVAATLLDDVLPVGVARGVVVLIGATLMALFLWLQLLLVWQSPERMPRAVYETLFVFLLVAAWNFRVWYLIWLMALAAVLPIGWPSWRAIAWTAGGLAGYAHFIWIWDWWDPGFPVIQAVGVAILTGPAVVVTLIELRWQLARRQPGHPWPGDS
jgi:alpha-1,6-mannosyltransferase